MWSMETKTFSKVNMIAYENTNDTDTVIQWNCY